MIGQWRLRAYLTTLVAASSLAVLGIAVSAVKEATTAYREASLDRLRDVARMLALAVERDLSHHQALLRTLTALHDDTESSQERLRRALPELGEARIAHVTAADPQPAEALPAGLLQAALASSEPVLSDLYRPSPGADFRIALAAHDPAEGDVHVLTLSPRHLVRIAPQAGTADASLLVAVTDGTGRIVARSRDDALFLGRQVPDWAKLQAEQTHEGVLEVVTAEGQPVELAFRKLAGTPGWIVAVGEPLHAFNARWQRPVRDLLIGGGFALLLSLALTVWLVRQALRPVRDLARDAQAILATDTLAPLAPTAPRRPTLRILEFESMRGSIGAAHAALRERAQALQISELRYRTLSQAGALVLWRSRPDGTFIEVAGWRSLTGEPDVQAMGMQWMSRVHPDDAAVIVQVQQQIAAGAREVDAEFRIAGAGGMFRWVRGRGAVVEDEALGVSEWVGVFEDIQDRRQAEERVAFMAHHDALTGLPNRVTFREALDAAIRRAGRGEQCAVLVMDLDGFKAVNDTLGHPAGDALLCAVAQRLRELVRETDTLARLGGDEFAVLQTQLGSAADAEGLALRIIEAVAREFVIDGQPVRIGISIGIHILTGTGLDADSCLKRADLALYESKHGGRGRHTVYQPKPA